MEDYNIKLLGKCCTNSIVYFDKKYNYALRVNAVSQPVSRKPGTTNITILQLMFTITLLQVNHCL